MYNAKITKSRDGYVVEFPDLVGCLTQGETRENALANASEALTLHLEAMIADNEEPPTPRFKGGVRVDVSDMRVHLAVAARLMRTTLRKTQAQVAKQAGMLQQQVDRFERAVGSPTTTTIQKIAQGLGVPFMELVQPRPPSLPDLEAEPARASKPPKPSSRAKPARTRSQAASAR